MRPQGGRTHLCHFHPIAWRKIMKKLNLDLNALEVESFETSRLSNWEGTVHGHDDVTEGGDTKCGGIQTCGEGCPGKVSAGPVTQCGGVQTCGAGCAK